MGFRRQRANVGPKIVGFPFRDPGGNAAWFNANRAYFIPINMIGPFKILELNQLITGAAGTELFDIGVYTSAGIREWSQRANVGAHGPIAQGTQITPCGASFRGGQHYLALAWNAATVSIAPALGLDPDRNLNARGAGCFSIAASYPLPASVNFAAADPQPQRVPAIWAVIE